MRTPLIRVGAGYRPDVRLCPRCREGRHEEHVREYLDRNDEVRICRCPKH